MGFLKRLRGTLRAESLDANVREELEFHIEQRSAELISGGLSQEDARRQAQRELGNTLKLREETREADVVIHLENWLRDTRQSLRALRQRPIFAITAIASLAIGIGAVASIFAVADAVIWKPLALPGEHRLYDLQESIRGEQRGSNGGRLKDWQGLASISGATGVYVESLVWRGPEGNELVRCFRTYTGLNATAQPIIAVGRAFTLEEEAGAPVALATNAFWVHRLNAEAPLRDRTIELSGKAYRIVGVLDASIGFPDGVDLWVPAPAGIQNGTREASYLGLIFRLKPDVALLQAQAEVTLAAVRLGQAYPKTDANLAATLSPLRDRVSRDARSPLLILLAVAVCVLFMICVNLAALLLSRGAERERESGLRSALGASPVSLIRLYLMETILLALTGGVLGVLLSFAAVGVLTHVLPGELSRLTDAHVDVRVLAFAVVVTLFAALTSGLAPALLAARNTALHEGARGASPNAGRKWLRSAFVIIEIALGVLLVTTGLRLGQAFLELSDRPKPFQVEDLVTATIPFPWSVKEELLHAFAAGALERFSTLPGVTQVGLVDQFPLLGGTQERDVRVEGVSTTAPVHAGFRLATPEYFSVMNVGLLAGRVFGARQQVEFVVNQSFAKRYFTDGPTHAHRLAFGKSEKWYDVVGVIADVPQSAARREAAPEVFTFYAHDYWPHLNFALRTNTPASVLAPMIRREVAKLDGTVIVQSVTPMRDKIGESARDSRVRTSLVGGCAALALLLMAIGIHGLIASDVATRWREFGVRLALGGTVPSLRVLLIRKTGLLAATGTALGIGAVVLTSSLLDAAFTGLPAVRLATIGGVMLAILLAAASAILWPLLRVARVDAATALRHE